MPPNFQHTTFAECCSKAEEVRRKYWPQNTIPVDIDDIMEFGAKLTPIPTPGLRTDADIYGFLSSDRKQIYLDNEVYKDEKFEAILRFTIAHELGHYFMHQKFYESHTFSDASEWRALLNEIEGTNLTAYETQADDFAARLLIPLDHLQREISSMASVLSITHGILHSKFEEEELKRMLLRQISETLHPKFNVPADNLYVQLHREKINPFAFIEDFAKSN